MYEPQEVPRLDQVASFARTALDDPRALGLPAWDAVNDDETGYVAPSYAVERLDEIIGVLSPDEWSRERVARALRVLGRHLAEVSADGLEDVEHPPAIFEEAAAAIDRALDEIDSAIRTLEDDDVIG